MSLMAELQYWSRGKCIYYWFGNAYGLTGKKDKAGRPLAIYLGGEQQVKEALKKGVSLGKKVLDEILKREAESSKVKGA
jgi:hypothetical protein